MERIELAAPAKINLYLRVTGRRPDGYHTLATLMQKVSLFDTLTLQLQDERGISLQCPGSDLPSDEGNLAYRAARVFYQAYSPCTRSGVAITLRKLIPAAAGLGGGSSDAASVLVGLNHLYGTPLSRATLADLALGLGADVPFLVQDAPAAWATGIGEVLSPAVPLAGWHVVLVTPEFSVSTKWAFETFALTGQENNRNLPSSQKTDSADHRRCPFLGRAIRPAELVNELETVTCERYPELGSIKQALRTAGAETAMMSGSGPTVFGLFTEEGAARACTMNMLRTYRQVHLVRALTDKDVSGECIVDGV